MPTVLLPDEEKSFQQWYSQWAQKAGLDPNPDSPEHQYDYRGAWKAGIEPRIDPADNRYHWDSRFKADDHPNRFIDGIDTRTGQPGEAPTKSVPRLVPTPSTDDLIPLQEYFRQHSERKDPLNNPVRRLNGEVVTPRDMVQQGSRALIPRLRGPVELPKGNRVVPKSLTDIQPVATQLRDKMTEAAPAYAQSPPNIARPMEIESTREKATNDDVDRIMKLLDQIHPEAPGA